MQGEFAQGLSLSQRDVASSQLLAELFDQCAIDSRVDLPDQSIGHIRAWHGHIHAQDDDRDTSIDALVEVVNVRTSVTARISAEPTTLASLYGVCIGCM